MYRYTNEFEKTMKKIKSLSVRCRIFAVAVICNFIILNKLYAAEFNQPHINVTGVSQIEVKPDTANISISVNAVKPTANEAKTEADQAVANLLNRLKKFDINKDDISSANLNLNTEYRYPPKQERKLIGFRASRNIMVAVSQLENVSKVLDEAIKSGANQVNGISFTVKDKNKYLEQARTLAIKDAKEKAQSLAKGFDTEIQGVWEIKYQNAQPVNQPMFKGRMMLSDAAESDNGYQNSKITFNDRVEVVFTLK